MAISSGYGISWSLPLHAARPGLSGSWVPTTPAAIRSTIAGSLRQTQVVWAWLVHGQSSRSRVPSKLHCSDVERCSLAFRRLLCEHGGDGVVSPWVLVCRGLFSQRGPLGLLQLVGPAVDLSGTSHGRSCGRRVVVGPSAYGNFDFAWSLGVRCWVGLPYVSAAA